MPSNTAGASKNPGANPTAASSTGANGSNSGTAAAATDNENRGLPYYEKLRRELRDTLQKKRLMDKSMVFTCILYSKKEAHELILMCPCKGPT